jgi:ATP-binding cassette subfamily B protein
MDEATSSVDTLTEALIQKGMELLMKGRTSFIIAHRLSTIKRADRILVIEDGRIAEMGSHAELLRAGGKYYQLYTRQFRKQIDDSLEHLQDQAVSG